MRRIYYTGYPAPARQVADQARTSTGFTHAPGGSVRAAPSLLELLMRENFGPDVHTPPARKRRLRVQPDGKE